jgi:hypothetical protein
VRYLLDWIGLRLRAQMAFWHSAIRPASIDGCRAYW